jgi:peptide/nickel transport system permease protein
LLRVHLLPGLAPTLVAAGTVALAAAIPLEAALSYLGLGVPLPHASWGNIIAGAEGQLLRRWWVVLFPIIAIVGSVYALNLVAERLRPRTEHGAP